MNRGIFLIGLVLILFSGCTSTSFVFTAMIVDDLVNNATVYSSQKIEDSFEPISTTNCIIDDTTIDFERGTVSSNGRWSIGNGQAPHGAIAFCNGTIVGITGMCSGSRIGTLSISPVINAVAETSCIIGMLNSTDGGYGNTSICNIPFNELDRVGLRANTEVGTWTTCVGTLIIDYD